MKSAVDRLMRRRQSARDYYHRKGKAKRQEKRKAKLEQVQQIVDESYPPEDTSGFRLDSECWGDYHFEEDGEED